jgi:hypothetical protein
MKYFKTKIIKLNQNQESKKAKRVKQNARKPERIITQCGIEEKKKYKIVYRRVFGNDVIEIKEKLNKSNGDKEIQKKVFEEEKEKKKKEGNWVNNENLDKVYFPCYCSFLSGGNKRYGVILTDDFQGKRYYSLHLFKKQISNRKCTAWMRTTDLRWLFITYKINVLKGETKIFEG